MIGRLRGTLAEKQPPLLLVDVGGVFYEVLVPMTSIYRLPEVGSEVVLDTHLAVAETVQQLYGFAGRQDRDLFRALIKVNGVGPKLGLAILSGMDANEIVRCVRDNNVGALVKLPGVGKKTAERLLIDLRDRLKGWQQGVSAGTVDSGHTEEGVAPAHGSGENAMIAEAESALIALGYKPVQATQVIAATQREHQVERSEELIRLALRSLASA